MNIPLQHSQQSELDPIVDLEKNILKFYSKTNWERHNCRHDWAWFSDELKKMLWERQKRLDDSFVWTPEAVERFVSINDKIQDCFDKLYVEQIQVHDNIEKRLADKNETFLNNFNLDLRVVPFVCSLNKDGDVVENDGIFEILCNLTKPISLQFMGIEREERDDIHFDRSLNWNHATPAFRCKELEDVYIGYHLHELSDDCYWAISDILCINRIWGEVIIDYQRGIELFEVATDQKHFD